MDWGRRQRLLVSALGHPASARLSSQYGRGETTSPDWGRQRSIPCPALLTFVPLPWTGGVTLLQSLARSFDRSSHSPSAPPWTGGVAVSLDLPDHNQQTPSILYPYSYHHYPIFPSTDHTNGPGDILPDSVTVIPSSQPSDPLPPSSFAPTLPSFRFPLKTHVC